MLRVHCLYYVYHGNLLLFTALECQEHGSTVLVDAGARLAGELPFSAPLPSVHDGYSPPDARAAVPLTSIVGVSPRRAGAEGWYQIQMQDIWGPALDLLPLPRTS